jgi:hypothetical protein
MSMTEHDDPINPSYYRRDGIECIDAIEAAVTPITDPSVAFAVGSIIKYVWRAFEKHQSPIPCLLKARWFLDRALRLLGYQAPEAHEATGGDEIG